jgi:outer membrane lipoprotein SlyB
VEVSRPRIASPAAACADCGVVESIHADVKKSVAYQVRVRMNDGTLRTIQENAPPAFAVGQKVRVTGQGVYATG